MSTIKANTLTAADLNTDLTLTGNGTGVVDLGAGAKLNGTAFGTAATLNAGTSANQLVQLDGSGNLPAVNGSALTNLPSPTQAPLPFFESVKATSGETAGVFSYFDEYQRRQVANNTTTYMYGKVFGVFSGEFEVGYRLSYTWGWGDIHLTSSDNFDFDTNQYISNTTNNFSALNNSSNAQFVLYKNNSLVYSTSGQSAYDGKIYRDSSGDIVFTRPGGSYTMATGTTYDCVIFTEIQPRNPSYSDAWTRINHAFTVAGS